jgi:hypothetical protein
MGHPNAAADFLKAMALGRRVRDIGAPHVARRMDKVQNISQALTTLLNVWACQSDTSKVTALFNKRMANNVQKP